METSSFLFYKPYIVLIANTSNKISFIQQTHTSVYPEGVRVLTKGQKEGFP